MDIQLKKGLLDVCVLSVLRKEESYGYKIISDIAPYIEISESTLYPILKRLEATGAALFVSGFAFILAGFADFVYFIVQMCLLGVSGALVAHLGLGLGIAAAGFLLTPLFLYLTKVFFRLCGKVFTVTGRIVTGKKREAN